MLKEKLRGDKPRWLILLIDMWVVWSTYVFCYYLVFKQRGDIVWEPLSAQLITATIVYFVFFLVFQPYKSVIHRTGLRDLQRIAGTVSCAFVILVTIGWLFELEPLPHSIATIFRTFYYTQLLLHAFMTGFFLCFIRIIYRSLHHALF